jgi:DNA invertase Pin-like site-specific DNA recombinase
MVVGEFVDRGVCGSKDRRPQLDLLMDKVHRGGVDVVAVWKFDRFARSVRHLVLALDEFRARGVDFFSSRDAIDTSAPAGRFVFAVIAAVAELERELIRERTRAGLQAARRRGARLGRPKARFDIDKAVKLRAEGRSYEAIASLLGVSVGTIHGAISRLQKTSPNTVHGGA